MSSVRNAAERHRLLVEWNDTGRDYPRHLCLHQLFEAAADQAPEAVALVDGTAEITYAELERRANQVARHLQRLGVAPESLVGICTPRTADMIAGMLGTLKAGAAYLSLDPAYPRERLAFMLEDSAAPVVLTQERLLDGLGAAARAGSTAFVCFDRDAEALEAESAQRLPSAAGPGSLAYAIYTSGSTGRPKGVAIEHRSAVVLCHWAREVFPAADLAGMLASTSINFDLSVFEIFVPLAWGGTVILAENALALPRLPAAGRVTFVNTVPSAIAELVRAGSLPSTVRTVGLAGEPLKGVLAERIYAREVHAVYNLYGPSEDTTYSTWVRVEPGAQGEPTIGRPIAGTELYLLRPGMEVVSAGEEGEVHLGGQGLARGYLNRPDLTAERFLPDPFSGRPGARLYRVGDLGRFLPGGEVQFLGRVDHQVKIRGFRIELGEIEAALSRHPAVMEAVVTARLAGSAEEGDLRLVAYVEPHPGITPDPPSLRSFLRERLPVHMAPSVFIFLDPLPRTPNGKVDRKALPEPDWAASASRGTEEDEAAAPRTALEELVAGLWCEALGASHVGLHDHFLELGGHSLLAARLVSRVRDTLGIQADLPALFAHPTVAGFAAELERLRGGRAEGMPPLRPAPREEDLPASLMQSRLWFLDQLAPGSPFNNVAIAAHLTGALRPEALELGLREIVRRHESLRTTFDDRGGPLLQRIAPRLDLDLPVIDLAALPPALRTAEMERLSAARARVPFDLRRGPVLRAELLRLGAGEHRLLLVLHHNVADDWSVWVLFRELSALYRAFVAGNPHPLPDPMAVQYADFAVWQSRWLDTPGAMDDFVAHARRLLADVPTDLDLPADRPRPPLPTFRGRLHRFTLPSTLVPGLRTLSRREGATLFMTLLAAFEVHAARFTGRQRFLIGSPTASRSRTELEGLIGLVSNTAVWRADLTGSPDFPTLLRRVRETVLAGSRFDALPFERVPTDLKAAKKDSYSSFLQLLFVLQTVPRPEPELAPGLRVRTWEMDTGTSKVDLSLFLWDDDGLTGAVEYSTDLFDPATILRLVDQYRRVLEGILAAPEARVTEIDLLSPAERWQVAGEWSAAAGGRKVLRAVDAALQPSPIGVAGDLYEAGEDGLRRTGDRARFRADGRLEVFAPPDQPAAVDSQASTQATGSTAAFGALEELIAGVWERVLGIEGIGHQQSFFALGGHSLLATQVLSRLRDLLKVEVPFRALFERPTVAGLARAIRDERRTSTLPPLEPGARKGRDGCDGCRRLSFAQQRLWFLDRLDPGTAVLNLPSLYSVHGPLSTAALGKTLAEIVRRHEALRTTIATIATPDQEAVQLVHPPSAPELPRVDLSSLPAERRRGEADRLVEREARRGFDPERGPLVRFLLLRSGTDDHRFLATFHHLVSDGGSLILFERELVALYGAFSAGRPSPLADPAVQYGDYAAWQRLCLTGDHLREDLAFWRERLAPPVPALRLPTDRPRPAVPSSRGALAQATFPRELTAAVRELSRREGSTLYITLMTAFLALLHRATGQRDITLGTPVSLRDHSQLEDVIGLFVNTLALRAEVAPGASFRDLLAHVRERVLEAFTYRDLPFERLVEELQPERGAHETPFFQLMFSLQAMQEETLRAGDLELRLLDLENGTAQFELTLYMVDTGHDLVALAEYRTDLFAAATIDRMLGAYQSLLEAAVAAPEVPLAGLPVRDWLAAVAPVSATASVAERPAAMESSEEREARLNAKRDQLSDEQKEQLRQRMQRLRRR